MPITGALATVAEARTYLRRPDSNDDAMITLLIDYATAAIEKFCARKLLTRSHGALIHDGSGTARLVIKEYPVTTFTSGKQVYKDGVTADRTIDTTGFEIERGRVIYIPKEGWPKGCQNIKIDCIAGYLTTTAEAAALKHWCLRWVQVMWQDYTSGINRGATVSAGGESITFPDSPMPADVERGLLPFVRLV